MNLEPVGKIKFLIDTTSMKKIKSAIFGEDYITKE